MRLSKALPLSERPPVCCSSRLGRLTWHDCGKTMTLASLGRHHACAIFGGGKGPRRLERSVCSATLWHQRPKPRHECLGTAVIAEVLQCLATTICRRCWRGFGARIERTRQHVALGRSITHRHQAPYRPDIRRGLRSKSLHSDSDKTDSRFKW